MADDTVIEVVGVSKVFRLPHEKITTVKGLFTNMFRRNSYENQEALKNISFEVKKGEFFGIVGRNGSGKSTLLKMLAGIYTPTTGEFKTKGSLVPFIELGVGFNPELTGRENVFLNGSLLGFNRTEMQAKYKDIVEFAELEEFMDQKLKNYSSGMQVRLAFSIAIRAKSDILLLDEVLAVGDAAFQQKCNDYFEKVKKEKKTVILVTHDMDAVEKYCDRALLIHKGEMKMIGAPTEIANQYMLDNYDPERVALTATNTLSSFVKSLDLKVKSGNRLTGDDTLEFDIEYVLTADVPVYIGISVMFQDTAIIQHNSRLTSLKHDKNTKHIVNYKLPLKKFNKAALKLDVAIFKEQNGQLIGYKSNACEFFVAAQVEFTGGPMLSDGVWEQRK